MTENREFKKEKLLQLLSDAKREAQTLASKGREVVKRGQYVADLASCNEEFIRLVPDDTILPPSLWDQQITSWIMFSNTAQEAITGLNVMQPLAFVTGFYFRCIECGHIIGLYRRHAFGVAGQSA